MEDCLGLSSNAAIAPLDATVAFVVDSDWEVKGSGIYTFVRSVVPAWKQYPSFRLVLRSRKVSYPSGESHVRFVKDPPIPLKGGIVNIRFWGLLLLVGHLRMFMRECRFLLSYRSILSHAVIVVNSFGCEILPIACRFLFPYSRIIAIAHTHPNLGGKEHWVRRLVEFLCYRCCSYVVFNSEALQIMWEKKLKQKISKGVVVRHGMKIPERMPVPGGNPEKMPGVVDIVCVGLFYRWKGQLALIEAWPEVLTGCQVPVRLVLVGDGVCLDAAKEKAKTLGLEEQVVFCGFQKDGADFFNGGDIALHYPVEPEAFGLVLLEAMGRGKPVIAPAHGGATEIVVDGETGILVEPGSRKALVEAVCRLAGDVELRERMGAAGRERVRKEFSVEKMLAGYDKVFREVSG